MPSTVRSGEPSAPTKSTRSKSKNHSKDASAETPSPSIKKSIKSRKLAPTQPSEEDEIGDAIVVASQPPVEQTQAAYTTSLVSQPAVGPTVAEEVSEASNNMETPKKLSRKKSKLRWAKQGSGAEKRTAEAAAAAKDGIQSGGGGGVNQEATREPLSGGDEKNTLDSTTGGAVLKKEKKKKGKAQRADTTPKKSQKSGLSSAKKSKPKEKTKHEHTEARKTNSEIPRWKISQSMGGRFLPIDPIFSKNEQFIFIALAHTLRVYSSKTSSLVRSLDTPGVRDDIPLDSTQRIVSYTLDPIDENQLFIATFSGSVYLWNWSEGHLVESWDVGQNILLLEVCDGEEEKPTASEETEVPAIPSSGRSVYLVTIGKEQFNKREKAERQNKGPAEEKASESSAKPNKSSQSEFQQKIHEYTEKLIQLQLEERKAQGSHDWKFERATLLPKTSDTGAAASVQLQLMHRLPKPVTAFKVVQKGEIIVAISAWTLLVGNKSTEVSIDETQEKRKPTPWGSWRSFDVGKTASCLDVKIFPEAKSKKNKSLEKRVRGSVAVGDIHGQIYLWQSILDPGSRGDQPGDVRRMHWHRNSVGSLKFSEDGHYIISGGNETVLVLWQIETGYKQFLPHLTSAIENIVVSPSGSSYAIRLADNSVMILSTTELKPTANISGFQSAATPIRLVNQPDTSVEKTIDNFKQAANPTACPPRVHCTVNSSKPNQLLLATSSHSTSTIILAANNQSVDPAPYLQTYDITSDRAIAKQALARTHASDLKIGPFGNTLVEPDITLLSISPNGDWLATLDEWTPPPNDLTDSTISQTIDGREVYLKFWRKDNKNGWDLSTRIDAPHPSALTGTVGGGVKVFDLLALPFPPPIVPESTVTSATSSRPKLPTFATLGADGYVRLWRARVRTRKGGEVVKTTIPGEPDSQPQEQVNWHCRKAIQFTKSVPYEGYGAMAVSQDGSVIAVAISCPTNCLSTPTINTSIPATPPTTTPTSPTSNIPTSTIYILDPHTSTVRHTLLGMQPGTISSIRIYNRFLIVLGTHKLIVFDLVKGGVQWDVPTAILAGNTSINLKSEELFLDCSTGGFAVGINVPPPPAPTNLEEELLAAEGKMGRDKRRHRGRIIIFDPSTPVSRPGFVVTLPKDVGITALKGLSGENSASGEGKGGYVYLDTFSKIKFITPFLRHTARSEAIVQEESAPKPIPTVTSKSGLSSLYIPSAATATPVDAAALEDANPRPPVAPEVLSNVFFAAEVAQGEYGYGMIHLEEVFDRVMGLYARPPLRSGGGDEYEGDKVQERGDEMEVD